jgi:hypothetical protein
MPAGDRAAEVGRGEHVDRQGPDPQHPGLPEPHVDHRLEPARGPDDVAEGRIVEVDQRGADPNATADRQVARDREARSSSAGASPSVRCAGGPPSSRSPAASTRRAAERCAPSHALAASGETPSRSRSSRSPGSTVLLPALHAASAATQTTPHEDRTAINDHRNPNRAAHSDDDQRGRGLPPSVKPAYDPHTSGAR